MIRLTKIMKQNKALFLAYDQGLEHGPTDFDDKNIDPNYILDIAKRAKFNAVILQKGIVEKYYRKQAPLIIKLNGKTSLIDGEPIATQLCTVKEAIKLGAVAVGYTIYLGSIHEPQMLSEFENIEREAHEHGLPVIAWMYPRGRAIKDELSRETLAYAARVGLEIGADIVKMKYNGNKNDLQWVVKSAGKTKVVIAGGTKKEEQSFLEEAKDIMEAGAAGLAIGRNIWQHPRPLEIAQKLKEIIWKRKDKR
ncbi:MAG: hypothetical protein PHF11_07385 [Candidatus Omnitrophica bacterium]|nr:hypothetical protein [Candidatus Omnitrophota bacterium]